MNISLKWRQKVGLAIASLWLCWLVVKGFSVGLPDAAKDLLEVIHHIEAIAVGSWLNPLLEVIVRSLSSLGISLQLEPHSRYAFNLMGLKLIGDAQVDYRRYKKALAEKDSGGWAFLGKLRYALHAREFRFLAFETVLGFCIALVSAIGVSQYPFGGTNVTFAIWVIGAIVFYELVKAVGHVWFDLYGKGWKSNVRRYFGQFFLPTCITAGLAFLVSHWLAELATQRNDGLLTVLVFILLLSIQQFASAGWTLAENWRRRTKGPRYRELAQVTIGVQMLVLLISILGWMVILTLFAKLKGLLG